MRVLVFTTLFPNHEHPNDGIFIKQRMFHFAHLPEREIRVVAPVPYCPSWFRLEPWHGYSKIWPYEVMEGIPVYHPKYPLVPKVSMPFHAYLLFAASLSLVRKIQKTFPFDLVDGHYIYPDGLAAVLLGKFFRKPVVLSARGSDINQFSRFPLIRAHIRRALREADALISVCEALRREMTSLGVPRSKIAVIPNGVDPERFSRIPKERARAQLGIPSEQKIILSVGSLISRKGFHLLMEAVSQMDGTPGLPHLYIIGEGPMRQQLRNLSKKLGISQRVHLVGQKPNGELHCWYSAADVFCLASEREGWANVIMEALACGCPVVATNVYGAPEILTTPTVGTLVERRAQAIAEALEDALRGGWDNVKIRNHVAHRSWSEVAREVDRVFQECLKRALPARDLRNPSSARTSLLS